MTTYHPTGTIRVLTAAEQSTMERRARASSSTRAHTTDTARRTMQAAVADIVSTLREFAHQWVRSQEHRAGF